MLSGVVLLLLRHYCILGTLPGVVDCFLVYPHPLPSERIILLLVVLVIEAGLPVELGGLYVVEGRGKVHIHVCLDDANGVVLVFGLDLEDVDIKLLAKNLNGNGVFLVQTGEVPQLILQNGLGIVEFDELGLMGLQLDHVANVPETFLEVRDQGHGGRTPWLGEFQHFEHPRRNVAQSFLRHELQHSAIRHLRTVLQAEHQGIFVFGTQQRVQLVQR